MPMSLTDERRASLIAYCRLTEDDLGPDDPALLETFYLAAVGYMEQSGVSLPEEGTPRRAMYDLLVNRMVLSDWDNRNAVVTTPVTENIRFRQMLNQMKETEVSDLDT